MKLLECGKIQPQRFINVNISEEQLLKDILGEGTYGQVWRVEKGLFDGDSVIKINTRDADSVGFENIKELDILLKVKKHPFFTQIKSIIIHNFEVDKEGDNEIDITHFILKREHCTLRHLIDVNKCNDPVKYSYQLATALQYLHEKDIIHGDIKPENILYNADYDKIVLADFGISLYYDTIFNYMVKTLYTRDYRPPEMTTLVMPKFSMDVFAYGYVIYEMMTRKSAALTNLENIKTCGELQVLVKNCTAKDPKSRPSMNDIIKFHSFRRHNNKIAVIPLPYKTIFLHYNFNAPERKVIQTFYTQKCLNIRINYHSYAILVHMMNVKKFKDVMLIKQLLETSACIFIKLFSNLDNYPNQIKKINLELFNESLEREIIEEFSSYGIYFKTLYEYIKEYEKDLADMQLLIQFFNKWIEFSSENSFSDLGNFYNRVNFGKK